MTKLEDSEEKDNNKFDIEGIEQGQIINIRSSVHLN